MEFEPLLQHGFDSLTQLFIVLTFICEAVLFVMILVGNA